MTAPLRIGDVVTVVLPGSRPEGHEQQGFRPAVVVGLPGMLGSLRFPMVVVVPFTTDRGQPWASTSPRVYQRVAAGHGLPVDSIALVDQVRALDEARIVVRRGTLPDALVSPILDALRDLLVRTTP